MNRENTKTRNNLKKNANWPVLFNDIARFRVLLARFPEPGTLNPWVARRRSKQLTKGPLTQQLTTDH